MLASLLCLAVCAPAAAGASGATYSGTISYARSFTAPESGECWDGVDGTESVSENWRISFSDATIPTGGQSIEVPAQITGVMHEHVSCDPNNGYPADDDLYASQSGTVGLRMRSDSPGHLTFWGIDNTSGRGLAGTETGDTIGGPGSTTSPITISPLLADFGQPTLTVPTTGVTGESFVIPWDQNLGTADPTQTEPGRVSVSLNAPAELHANNDFGKSTGKPVAVRVLANDVGVGLKILRTGHRAAHGTATCGQNGVCVYVPGRSYAGHDSFSYSVADAGGQTASARVFIRSNGGAGIKFASSNTFPLTTWAFTTPSGKPSCGSDYLTVTFYSNKRDFDVNGTLNPDTTCGGSSFNSQSPWGVYIQYQEAISNSTDPGFTRLSSNPRDANAQSGGITLATHVHHFTWPTTHLQGVRLRMCADMPNFDKCNNWHWVANPWY